MAQAQPPGPGLPEHAPSVNTRVVTLRRYSARRDTNGTVANGTVAPEPSASAASAHDPLGSLIPVTPEGFLNQIPDIDPAETSEWLDALEAVTVQRGRNRAEYLVGRLIQRAAELDIGTSPSVSTPYVNTIGAQAEPWFPGDEAIEKRIRAFIRWNAVAMVVRANRAADGIGGHLSTFASSAGLYDVGFNHFFMGKDGGNPGDHIYFQGHAAPGVYCPRLSSRGASTKHHLDRFRQ